MKDEFRKKKVLVKLKLWISDEICRQIKMWNILYRKIKNQPNNMKLNNILKLIDIT